MKSERASIRAFKSLKKRLLLHLSLVGIVGNAISMILIARIAMIAMFASKRLTIIVSFLENVSLKITSEPFPIPFVYFSCALYTSLYSLASISSGLPQHPEVLTANQI